MKLSCPSACLATLCLVVYLILSSTAAKSATEMGEADLARAKAYRANMLTMEEERIVGQRLAYLYEQRHMPSKDAKIQARLNQVAAPLRRLIPAQALEITVLRSTRPEAVSFPPGRVFITTALINLASTDDELAAVIAHEAAHISSHHLAHLVGTALALPEAEREGFPSRRAIISGQATQFAFPAALEDIRLGCEMQADRLAVELLRLAGYRSVALATVLDNLSAQLSPRAQRERVALQSRVALLYKTTLPVAE